MNKSARLLFVIIILLSNAVNLLATDYTSAGSGSWSNSSTWSPAGVPGAGDNVTIASGNTVTIDQDVEINNLTINGSLVIGNDATVRNLTVDGTVTIASGGSFTVADYDITHQVIFKGNITNDGTLDFYNSSSRVADVTFDASSASITVGGSNSPQFNSITFSGGTTTANVAFDIEGSVTIDNGATFDAGTYTHTVAGNWTVNGSGQLTGNCTIDMDGSLIQSITTSATFYNLTYNGGGTGVISGNITVTHDFHVTNNTEVHTNTTNYFQGNFTVDDGSQFEATGGTCSFNLSGDQTVTIGTTDGQTNTEFYNAYFQGSGTKTIDGDMVVKHYFQLDKGVTIEDNGDTHTQTFYNNCYFNGTCNFSGTILFKGGTCYDTDDGNFTLGTANILVKGYTYIGENTTMNVNGDFTIDVNDNGSHIGFIINNNAALVGQSSKTLTVKNNTSLYIRGSNNFPTGFGTITFEPGSYARYDAALNDQTIYSGVTYWHLYLSSGTSKTPDGNLDVNGNLYIYNSTELKLQNNDMNLAGSIVNSDQAWGNGSLSATGGTVTLDAQDANQYIYNAGSGSYTFNNLTLTLTNPTAAHLKVFNDNVVVNGNFTATNTGGDATKRLYVDINDYTISGGGDFTLGANVWLLTSGTNSFANTMSSFNGTKTLDVNSTVRFDRNDGTAQDIPGDFTYGNIELSGRGDKTPQANIDINGDLHALNGNVDLNDNTHQINIAGDWLMSLGTTDKITGNCYIIFDGTNQSISSSHFSHVYFSGSGTKTITGTLDVLNDLVIEDGVTVQTDQYIGIQGNWTEQGTGVFHQTGARTTFNGTTANQTITANDNSYFYSLYIDKSSSNKLVTLNSNVHVHGTLNFVEDKAGLDLNGNNLYVSRDFYFRNGCSFTHNNGDVFFNGNDISQIIYNYNTTDTLVFHNVEFSGSAVKRLYGSPFRFEGNVFINNSTLDGQGVNMIVYGDWTNTGIFRHSATVYFIGKQNQTISQSSFHNVRFGGGNYTKTLSGDIVLTGSLWIDDATLDVSSSNHSITLDDHWYNDSTGSFLAHEGTVIITGEYNFISTGATNTAYNSGQVVSQGGTKDFYNLEINATNNDVWIILRGNLTVKNNFTIEKGRFYQSYDLNNYGMNDIYIGGDFVNQGIITSNNHGEKIYFNPSSGAHVFYPGDDNYYGPIVFDGAAGTSYSLQSNLSLYSGRALTINNGDIDLNSHKLTTSGSGGDITLNSGSLQVDSAAVLSIGNGATFTNAGGTFELIGASDAPASLIATSGNFSYVQTAGTIAANYYFIQSTSGNGLDIQGGSIDATNTLQNGTFSSGTGTAYITATGIDLGGDRNIDNVIFNTGPTYNVQRTSGTGAMNFVNAGGALSGEDYDNDNGDPGSLINWTYPGAVYWDGSTDGDGDNAHWSDPHNWSNDEVPSSSSQVILDHSYVSGSYTVEISNDNASAKNVFINSGSDAITLKLDGKNLAINQDITIGSNSVLTQTNATDTIFVGGSWSNEGTFNEGTAVTVFNPTSGTHTITTQGAGDAFYDLIINGSGGKDLISSDLDVNGDIKLLSGTLSAGTNTITVAGNWSRTGGATLDYGTSTVNFDGSDQTINGGEFYNFMTSNSGTKTITANINVTHDLTIGSGTVLNGGGNVIYVGHNWTNEVGNSGFSQTGSGTVIFNGTNADQNIGSSTTQPTTFNNLTISGARTKYMRQNITVNGNLTINSAALYITDGTSIDGAGSSNNLNMSAGRIYVNGANNFPQNFENISITGGTVDYYADIDQTVYPTTYYNLMVRRIHSGNATTKTLGGDIDVKGTLYVYDDETTLDVDSHTIRLVGNLDKHGSTHPIVWGSDGTLIHYGGYWTVDPDIQGFNNVIKKNTGYMRVVYHSIDITGNMSILEDAYLVQDTVNITCTGSDKTFTLAATAAVYSYNPETLGSSTGRKAFPVGFANYSLHKDSRVYISGNAGDQVIYTKPTYGNLYISTRAEINVKLDGDLNVDGDFRMYYDDPTLVDNGHNINIAGANVDIRTYTPSSSSTMTFDGADQHIYDAGQGATVFDLNDVVFAGSGTKTLSNGGEDWYHVHGDITIDSGVTVYVPRRLDFSGSQWINKGTFNHTAYVINFNGTADQTIDPGEYNDFYAVDFQNTNGTIKFVNHGINVNNGTFTIENGATVDMNNLTHHIASVRITNNGGTFTTANASFVFDRNGTQYIPQLTCQDITLERTGQRAYSRYLEGSLSIDDLTIGEGIQLLCSQNADPSTTAYNITMTGNFINNGNFYAWGNTVDFESNNTDPKIIQQGNGYFHNVKFNQNIWGQNNRTYTLTQTTRFYEDMTIGKGATLVLNGQKLYLGNDDPNDPTEPNAEHHTIQSGGTLDVDAGSALVFSCRDKGNPILDVDGTLMVVGTNGDNATVTSEDWNSNSHRIEININDGGTIAAQYYLFNYLVDSGLYVDANATIDPTNNFSNGTWSNMNTSGSGKHYYLKCNADVSGIGTVENVTFNFNGTPTVGVHFNVKREAGSTGTLTFGGNISGLLGGSTYEADPEGENNSSSSLISWPPITEVYWTGAVSTDWFDKNNWSPAQVPDNNTNAIIPLKSNNPIINGQDAQCKDLRITDGILTIKAGHNLDVAGDVYIGTGSSDGMLAVEDPSTVITVTGNWTRGTNGLFVNGSSTVKFNATGGNVTINSRSSAFGNLTFDGGASFFITGAEVFVDNNFTIDNGTVKPSTNNYKIHIKGNYNNINGTYDNTTRGTVIFDGDNNQSITNAHFWNVEIDGSGNKTTQTALTIDNTLTIKNATLVAGCPIDMKGNVTIEATGSFDDGGYSHNFAGGYWTGNGSYSGSGTIVFNRSGYQYIKAGTFNNLTLKNNGGVILQGDINLTGNLSLLEPNYYLNVQTYQVTNTSGTGTFSMASARRIYVRGANNFPTGFQNYNIDETSYTFYDGTVDQTIAPVPVTYGHLYLDNSSKTLGGDIDVNGILYLYGDASLDVTSNNYRINIAGNWYNQQGATFYHHQGEVVFDGNRDHCYLYISDDSKDKNHFYDLSVNKPAGDLRSTTTDITVENNLRVVNGMLYQNQTMYVGGDMAALSGTFAAAGTYYLNKPSGSSNLQLNGSVLNNLTINSGATYYLQDDLLMNGQFNLIAGTFDANGKLVRMGNYGEANQISGVYKLGAGGILQLPNFGSLKINSGGEIWVVGDYNNIATVTHYTGRYYFSVENGGKIFARNYLFEYMSENGIYIKQGATIDPGYNFSYGTFTNIASGGTALRIENNQAFTEANGNPIQEVSFTGNPGGGASNVTKTLSAAGQIDFKNFSGDFAGEEFDNDPDSLINWITPPYITWTGNIDNDWFKSGNWHANYGAQRIPQSSDIVIIPQATNQPIIDHDGAVAKNITVEDDAILTLNSSAATDTTLTVYGDVNINGSIIMNSGNDTLAVQGNWYNSGMFLPGNGTVIFNSQAGTQSINNGTDNFYNLVINTVESAKLMSNITVSGSLTIKSGSLDMVSSYRILTVKGDFNNYGQFYHRNGKLVLAGSAAEQVFNPGSSEFYNIDISALSSTVVKLTSNNLSLAHNMNVNSGTFSLNSMVFNMGDGTGTDVLYINNGGTLLVNDNAELNMANDATVEVNDGGTIKLIGTDVDNPAYVQAQSGTFNFNVNSGGTIAAKYYDVKNTNANGFHIKAGATIDGTYNFSYGVWRDGTSPGQYLWLENDFSDFTVQKVYFHEGASVNVKRLSGSGVITFEDAQGLLAGADYEDDDPAHGESTGLIRWTYSHPQYVWTGNSSTDWHTADNWDVPTSVDPSGHAVPDANGIAKIPDVSGGSGNFPVISADNAVCYNLVINNGGRLTIQSDKNLDVTNSVTVYSGGTLTVTSGSNTTINVGDTWLISGTFNNGQSSTVVFDASSGKLLTITGQSQFYNLEINSTGNAEYYTGGPLHIQNDFTITSGKFTINSQTDTVYVGGDFSNASTFNNGSSIVVLNGADQNISMTGTGNFYKLTCQGSGTKSLTSDVTVENDLQISENTTLACAANTLTIKGDWVNRGTFDPGTGTVAFNGNSSQLIDNYNTETFYNLTINNTATTFPQIMLYGNVDVNGSNLTMTDGVIETSDTKMLTLGSNVSLTGGNTSASYINGPVTKKGSADFTFPIGDRTKFARLGISGMTATGTFVAQYHEQAYSDLANLGSGIDHVSGYEYWTLQRTAGTATPKVTLYWEDGSQSGIDNLSTLTVALYTGGQWEDQGNGSTTGDNSQGTITSNNNLSSFGPITFASTNEDNPLNGYTRWTGDISGDWSNPNNWTLGVPTGVKDALIPSSSTNNPVIDDDAVVRKLTIEQYASLTINPGKSLTTQGKLYINGNLILRSDANGVATLINKQSISYGAYCHVTTQLYLTAKRYHYVSVPVNNCNTARFKKDPFGVDYNHNLYYYNEAGDTWNQLGTDWIEKNGNMDIAQGYAYYTDRNVTITMTRSNSGDFNTGDRSLTLTYTGNTETKDNGDPYVLHRGWNLIGNPFPAYLDWDAAGWTKTNIYNSIYFWNGSNYSYYVPASDPDGPQDEGLGTNNASNYIPPMQGFFVKVKEDAANPDDDQTGTILIPESARVTSTQAYWKKTAAKDNVIKLTASNGKSYKDETVIAARNGATSAFDDNYDAFKLFTPTPGYPQIYTVLDQGTRCAINSLPEFTKNTVIHVGFETNKKGDYSLSVNDFNLPGIDTAYFVDTYNDSTMLLQNLNYTFSSDAGEFDDRFIIKFTLHPLDTSNTQLTQIKIYASGQTLYLESATPDAIVGNIYIYDISGQLIAEHYNQAESYASIPLKGLANGVYVVNIKSKYGSFTGKIVIY